MNVPRFILDTDTCIYIARRNPAGVSRRLARLKPGDLGMSVITYGELGFGAQRSSRAAESSLVLKQLTELVPVLPLPAAAAVHYGDIRAALARRGTPIGHNDLWIASHVRSLGATLVTNNVKEFGRVEGLKVENWVAARNS